MTSTKSVLLFAILTAALVLSSCASSSASADDEFAASCSIRRSALGPFGTEQPLGSTLSEAEAEAQAAATGFDEWIEIQAEGNWSTAWDLATANLGQGIHQDLSWIDVSGTLTDIYTAGDSYAFADLRVSRSFQGKIEHTSVPLFVGVSASQPAANFDAGCELTAVAVEDQNGGELVDVLDLLAASLVGS